MTIINTISTQNFASEVFDTIQDGIFIIDSDYTILQANPAFEKYVPEFLPIIGKKCYHISYKKEICDSCPAYTMFETGEGTSVVHYKTRDNIQQGLWIEHFAHPIKSADGEITTAICTIRNITKDKENENALKRYNDYFEQQKDVDMHSVIANGSVPLVFCDNSGIVQFVNTAFLSLTGFSEEDVLGTNFVNTYVDPESLADSHFSRFRSAFLAKEIDQHRQVVRLLCRNGETRWVDGTASAVKNSYGERVQMIFILLDITERYVMAQAVEEANEATYIMLESMPLTCILLDTEGSVVDCNQAALTQFDIPNKQEFCNRFYDLLPEYQPDGRRSRERVREYTLFMANKKQFDIHWTYKKLDGSLLHTEVTLVNVKRGDSYVVAGYTRDLSDLRTLEHVQHRDMLRTNALLELAEMTYQPEQEVIDYTIKSATLLTDSAAGYVVMLKHTKDTLLFRALILEQSLTCDLPVTTSDGVTHTLSPILTKCLDTRQVVIHDDLMSLPGPRVFPAGHSPIRTHMNFVIMGEVEPIGIIGVGNKETPYTEADTKQLTLLAQGLGNLLSRRKYTTGLEESKNVSDQANKAKSDFLAHMSHEIRTPLNGVIGLSDLLASTLLDEKQREYVQLINASGNSLLFLINDILDFSKIEAGKLEILSEAFDLVTVIGEVLTSLVSRSESKKLELGMSFGNNLPRKVKGDAGRLRQILINLVGNAIKFTHKGGIRIDAAVESTTEDAVVIKFNVIDTGIGIAQSGLDRLFKAFSQVDASTTRVYGGTGLGLAISMQLVQLMNGEIGVSSVEGKGSTFWFTIPFECDPKIIKCLQKADCLDRKCVYITDHTCSVFLNKEITTPYTPEGCSVLVVDDNEVQREALRIQLHNWGMQCIVCGSGIEALRLATDRRKREEPFDLFIVDSTIEDGLGIDLAQQLFELEGDSEDTHLIILRSISDDFTGHSLDEFRTEFVSKPVLASALFNAVMERIFAVKKQYDVDSGILSAEIGGKMERQTTAKYAKSVRQPLNAVDRFKSYLTGKVHILVVEDNRVNQIVATNILAEAGFTSDIANDGKEACSIIRDKSYDIILMDCQMPEIDGFAATGLIRQWESEQGKSHTPIIALTANAVKEEIQKCFDSGMDAYCSKPINPLTLIHLIEKWYDKTHLSEEAPK